MYTIEIAYKKSLITQKRLIIILLDLYIYNYVYG